MANEQTMKFYDAYKELEQIAKDMQDDPEKVIDVMEDKLKRAIELNKFCSDRLNKVKNMLDQYKTEKKTVENDTRQEQANCIGLKESTESDINDDIPF